MVKGTPAQSAALGAAYLIIYFTVKEKGEGKWPDV